jgi:hypothetical protein
MEDFMKKLKVIFIAGLIVASLTGVYVAANCSASATSCNASCSVNNVPPGGSSRCTAGPTNADCRGWDAAGNLCCSTGCQCPSGGGFGLCYIMIGSTCC